MSLPGGLTSLLSVEALQNDTKSWRKDDEAWIHTGFRHRTWHLRLAKHSENSSFLILIDLSISSSLKRAMMKMSWIFKVRATFSHRFSVSTSTIRMHCQQS